jgi:parallel beta-helix repeat protein
VDRTSGVDSNPGTQEKPWRTIQKAANSLSAGEMVIVLAGNYPERVQVTRSGAAGKPITFNVQGTVVMKGFTIRADFIKVRGFEITNTPDDYTEGLGIYVEGDHCVLSYNYIHYATRGGILLEDGSNGCILKANRLYRNSQYGITVRGSNHLVASNEIWATIQFHPAWKNAPSWVDADGIRFFGSGHTFRNNYIHDISLSQNENKNPHIDAFQTWDQDNRRAGRNCLFENNVIVLGRTATGFQLEGGTQDLIIRNNIVNSYGGVRAYKNGQSPVTRPANLYFYNNIFIGSLSYRNDGYPVGLGIRDTDKVVIKNNMLINQTGASIYLSNNSGVDVDYNLFYNADGSKPDSNRQPHDLWMVNPLFVNLGGGDFRLKPDSPAINAGISVPINHDFAGNARPSGGAYDIGAYEFQQ